ncbi:CusA/CzcA family heavy metal efflux RND transporter [Candidatus Poribacteria bacterium]|nr:MAG: CusA/CzcA family heavy metal efflux RND transporter [Candidatus Poribacteria bacterium]
MWSKITETSLRNRLLVICGVIAAVIIGFRMFQTAPIDVYPDINPPRITVLTEAHGWSPEEMETLVTLPIESSMNGAPDVTRVRSSSAIGLSLVFVEFEWGLDIYLARQMVSERLLLVAPNLPEGVDAPIILPTSSLLGEIMEYALIDESEGKEKLDPMEMRDIADWVIRYRLQSQGGIANVINIGGYIKQFQVFVNPERLVSYGISLEDVAHALEKSNDNAAGGFLIKDARELMIRGLGRISSVTDIENVVIDVREHNTPVLIKDVATVKIGSLPEIRRGAGSRNGEETVLGKIIKQPGENTLELSDKVAAELNSLEKTLPAGVQLEVEYAQADLIRRAVDTVKEALRDGAILVVIILIIFLFNIRTALITLTAIPLSLIIAIIVLLSQGGTLNIMTLAGLAIAVGMVVDDAIVYVENIFRRLQEYFHLRDLGDETDETPTQVVTRASDEMRVSIVFATLIIILVFLPLFSLSGIEGRMFRPLGWAVVISMAASLLVALTVVPVLSDLLLGRVRDIPLHEPIPGVDSSGKRVSGFFRNLVVQWRLFIVRLAPDSDVETALTLQPVVMWIKRAYRPILTFVLRLRWIVVIMALLLVILTIAAVPRLGREFLPVMDEATFTISVFSPPGTSLEESTRIGREMERKLEKIKDVTSVSSRTGRAEADEHAHDVNSHEIVVNFIPPDERDKTREELLAEVRDLLSTENFPGVQVSVGQPIQHRLDYLLSGVSAQVALKLFGPDLDTLRQKAEEIEAVMSGIDGVADLQVEQQVQVEQLQIKVKRFEAARYGLSVQDITHFAEAAFKGETVSQIIQGQRQYDLVVRIDPTLVKTVESFGNLKLRTPSGAFIPLKQVADVSFGFGPNTINRENVSRRIVIQCNVQNRDLGNFITEVEKEIKAHVDIPEEYFLTYGGQFESQQRAQKRILIQTCFVFIGIFILLYLAMGSMRLSILVILNLPLALIGGVVSVFLTDGVLSIPSMVGFILLFGIAVRNGIILVSHINALRSEGMSLYDAVVKGASERISPVLMTALTTGLGMLPLALAHGSGAELQKPLAIVISGGMITATFLTLLVLPALYYMVEKRNADQ